MAVTTKPNGTNLDGVGGGSPIATPATPSVKQAAPPGNSDGWLSDARGGFWVAATTAFCLVVGGGGHLLLLAATLGRQRGNVDTNWIGVVVLAVVAPAVLVGFLVGLLAWLKSRSPSDPTTPQRWRPIRPPWLGLAATLATALVLGAFCLSSWVASRVAVPWEPIVGSSLALVSIGAFGGFFLSSRRARVAFAASFILTFLLLLSYMLTLEALSAAADATQGGKNALTAVQTLLNDFRGDVGLIVAFYFGTDAAISGLKILKTRDADVADIARMDRDLAVPRAVER